MTPATPGDRFTFTEVCIVPRLKGKKLKRAKKKLGNAECRLGKKKGKRGGKVKKQNPAPGTELPAGGSVNVKLR
jgi:beta-lactam-binding protein with PASTA domain